MHANQQWLVVWLLFLPGALAYCQAPQKNASDENTNVTESKTLKLVQNFQRESLGGVVGLEISSDGRFLYASAYTKATLHVFAIDQQNGQLTLVEEITDRNKLQGATAFSLSPDGKLGVASAFTSSAVTLYQRDPTTGKLTLLDSINAKSSGVKGFQWPIRTAFSPDGKFVYIVDSGQSRSLLSITIPSVITLEVKDNRLTFVESFTTKEGEFANARGLAVHPNGKNLFVAASSGQSLVSLRRDAETGKLELVKAIRSDKTVANALDGAMSVVTDASGRFVYTLAGRYRGAGAIGVFSFDSERDEVSFLEAHQAGAPGLEQFAGGNQLALSPDGLRLYAVGTKSGTLSILDRDANNGKLKPIETVAFRSEWKGSVAGVVVAPNSRFVYVSGAEKDPSVTVLEVLP
jgi:6-phosphogluconolactonase (cycloisomerase 2 family)